MTALVNRLHLSRAELLGVGVLVGLIILLPVWKSDNAYVLGLGAFTAAFAIFAMSVYVMVSWAGEVPLGQALFYGIGAYGTGILMKDHGWSFLLAVLAAMAMAALVAAIVGLVTLHLTGAYFSIVSWGVAGVGVIVANNQTDLTGGALGLFGIPTAGIGPWSFSDPVTYLRVTGCILLGVVLALALIRGTAFGTRLNAGRVNERLARSVGINTFMSRVIAFVISAALAALSGSLTISYVSIVTPGTMSVFVTVEALLMVLIGGTGFLLGPILGAVFFKFVPEQIHLDPEVRNVVFAVLIVVVMLSAPGGLPEIASRFNPRALLRRLRDRGANDRIENSGKGEVDDRNRGEEVSRV